MKQLWIYLFAIIFIIACRQEIKSEKVTIDTASAKQFGSIWVKKGWLIDTVIVGVNDTAFVSKQEPIKDDIGDKRNEYLITVAFWNKTWPLLNFKNAIGAELYLVGDLDGDKSPELLLRPEWFSSCWTSVNLYSLKGNKWELIKNGSMYFCSDKYPLSKRIIKSGNGYSLLTDSLTEDKFITLKKEIKF